MSMPRTWEIWLVVAIVGTVAVFLFPDRLASGISMVARFALAGGVAYALDRVIFPYARPHLANTAEDQRSREIRRAVIVAGALIGAGMAL